MKKLNLQKYANANKEWDNVWAARPKGNQPVPNYYYYYYYMVILILCIFTYMTLWTAPYT